jgi:phage terminase large subunit GpA-like protein
MNTILQSVCEALLRVMRPIIQPPAEITPSQWAAANLIVPDGPHAGEKWDPALTPYIVEPLDQMGPASSVNRQVIRKAAQTGFSIMAICGVGHSIACDPQGGVLLVQPTQDALDKFIRDKLTPTIEATTALKAKVASQIARSGAGSTTYNKRYPGGSLQLVIANSAAGLRSITKKRRIKDEASEYPHDLDGQGSPHAMIEARGEAFLASGDWKETNISTPTIVGECYISEQFERGDKRYWHVDCPGCGEPFVFHFDLNFQFNDTYPYKAHYVAPCCGTVIEALQKNSLVRAGSRHAPPRDDGLPNGWIATAPGPGKFPSYHFDTLSSPFVPWDAVAERWINVQALNDQSELKTFWNLTRGEAYEVRGDTPDYLRLIERREEYPRGRIPPGPLLLTIAADVQMRGIYVEVVAHAHDRQSWVIHADYLDGATTAADQGAFAALSELWHRAWPDGYGNEWRADEFGIDSGYRTDIVYEWTRRHPGSKALKGVDGWGKVPLGVAVDVDISYAGRRMKGGAKVRAVGTWVMKSAFYADLALTGSSDGSAVTYPPGYCHFGAFLDENYFKQLTSEYLEEETYRGRPRKVWKLGNNRENHFLDARVYNRALANAYLTTYTADDWARAAKERGIPEDMQKPDLFAPRGFTPGIPPSSPPSDVDRFAAGTTADGDPFDRLAELNRGI